MLKPERWETNMVSSVVGLGFCIVRDLGKRKEEL